MISTTRVSKDAAGSDELSLVTVGDLRRLWKNLPDETPLVVGIRESHHFNSLVGHLSVDHAEIFPGPQHPIVVLDVAGLS